MLKLWLVTNKTSGELSLLATATPAYPGFVLEPAYFEIMEEGRYLLFPIAKSYYRMTPKHQLLILAEVGELGDGSTRGRHYEAQETLEKAFPEVVGISNPALSEDALELFQVLVKDPDAPLGIATRFLAREGMAFALKAYFLGIEAAS